MGDYTQLIALILGALGQYGPGLVQSIKDLIVGNPKQQGETDAAYIARINSQTNTKAADTTAADQSVIQDQGTGTVVDPNPSATLTVPATSNQPTTQPATTGTTSSTSPAGTTPGGILNVG